MKEYSQIKGLVYEMGEYLYELKGTRTEFNPPRVKFLIKKYRDHLKAAVTLSKTFIEKSSTTKAKTRKESLRIKSEISDVKKIYLKYSKILKSISKSPEK